MEEARQEANQRLCNLEGESGVIGKEREEVLEDYTKFIYNLETRDIDYRNPLEEHEKVFREFLNFRERVKQLIGEERMYCLLGTDRDVIELHSEQKKVISDHIKKK